MSALKLKVSGVCLGLLFVPCPLLVAASVYAQSLDGEPLIDFQHQWAHIKYQLPETGREAAYSRLYAQIKRARIAHPDRADLWTWEAIVLANEAGARHSLASIKMLGEAKELLEKAIVIRPDAALAYAFLGDLYHNMPGWPVGFGSDRKAGHYLKKALNIAPNSLDGNYFMGMYLRDRKHFSEAIPYLQRAMHAPPRPGMSVADTGRKADAARLLRHLRNMRH